MSWFLNNTNDLNTSNDADLSNQVQSLSSSVSAKLDKTGGTMSGAIGMGSNKVTGVANGTNSNDAVNKSQLDTKIGITDLNSRNMFFDTNKVGIGAAPLSTETLQVNGSVTCTQLVLNSQDLNGLLNTKLNLSGGTMSGALAMGSNKVTGVANGTTSNDAVNKSQLDTKLNSSGGSITGNINMNNQNISGCYNLDVTNNVTVAGNLTVSGTSTSINATNLAITDPLVAIGTGNTTTDIVDLGQFGSYNSSGVKYFSIFRDASDSGIVKAVHGLTVAPSGTVIDLTNAVKSTVQVGTLDATGITLNGTIFSDNEYATRPNVQYTISHAANAGSQDLLLYKTGANASRLKLQSDGTSNDAINLYTPHGGITLDSPNTNIFLKSLYQSLVIECPTLIRGMGVDSGGAYGNTIVNGAVSSIGPSDRVVNITTNSGAGVLYSIPPAVSLLNYQQIIVHNNTSTLITLGRAVSSAGFIDCPIAVLLHPGEYTQLLYNTSSTKWMMDSTALLVPECIWRAHRWTNDDMLSIFLNTSFTYLVKINFHNSTSTINGVSGFENITGVSTTFTGGTITAGSFSVYTSSNALTSTESNKFNNTVYNFGSGGTTRTLTFTSLTPGNYYEFVWYLLDSDNNTSRQLKVTDNITGVFTTLTNSPFSSGGANAPAVIYSYIFRFKGRNPSSYSFFLDDGTTNFLPSGLTLRNIGATL